MAEKITKQEAVRRALAHFGKEAKPTQMQGWIKEQFSIEMSTDHISTAKGEILRKAAGQGKQPAAKKPAPQKSAARESEPKPAAAPPQVKPTPAPAARGGIPLDDILAVKDLVDRLGAGPLHALIDAFAM